MVVIDPRVIVDLYQHLTQTNLERQFSLISDMVKVGVRTKSTPNAYMLKALHGAATTHLVETPGSYRQTSSHINNSDHQTPDAEDLPELVLQMFNNIRQWWEDQPVFFLAAYALWRTVWIHPFEDGNGRVARALSYIIICIKFQTLLPGYKSYSELIKDNSERYIEFIRHADATHESGNVDLEPLALFLASTIEKQISSTKLV